MEYGLSKKWTVTPRQRCDLEMLMTDAFAPLTGFISKEDYYNVLENVRLANNAIWPIPVTLDVDEKFAERVSVGESINLYDTDNTLLAIMTVKDKWMPDKHYEAEKIFETQDIKHPGVHYLFNESASWYLGGPIQVVNNPRHYNYTQLRHTPKELKALFDKFGWTRVIGFQTRNPIHKAHRALMLKAAEEIEGNILIHPVVGMTKRGDIDSFTRVRCYQKILRHFPNENVMLSLLQLAMRMAGPREALWHALIRKNYGCSHFIVGRDHAGPGNNSSNTPFYAPYQAQEFVASFEKEIGIEIMPFKEMVYAKERQEYISVDDLNPNETADFISGTSLRNHLQNDQSIPDWFSFPDIISELRRGYPPKHKKGFTIFFTGLSGSGKSTIAQALMEELMVVDKRSVSIVDGDSVRQLLKDKIGFSKEDRNLNIKLISYVSSEITKAGGIAICAVIAPYQSERQNSRNLISQHGAYIEVYNSTSLAVCEKRDVKGLYAKARAGIVKNFTGIDDVYEVPESPELSIDTSDLSIEQSVGKIMTFLYSNNYLQSRTLAKMHRVEEEVSFNKA